MQQKDIDRVFKDMDNIFKDIDKTFKKVDSDVNRVFDDMDKILKKINGGNIARKTEVGPWKEWFAWRPVKIKNKRIWMKKVYRRTINTYVDQDDWTRYEYGDIFDVLKEAGSKQSFQADEVQQGPA